MNIRTISLVCFGFVAVFGLTACHDPAQPVQRKKYNVSRCLSMDGNSAQRAQCIKEETDRNDGDISGHNGNPFSYIY